MNISCFRFWRIHRVWGLAMAQHPEATDKCVWRHSCSPASQDVQAWCYPASLNLGPLQLSHWFWWGSPGPTTMIWLSCMHQLAITTQHAWLSAPWTTILTSLHQATLSLPGAPGRPNPAVPQHPWWTCRCDLTCLIWCTRRLDLLNGETKK